MTAVAELILLSETPKTLWLLPDDELIDLLQEDLITKECMLVSPVEILGNTDLEMTLDGKVFAPNDWNPGDSDGSPVILEYVPEGQSQFPGYNHPTWMMTHLHSPFFRSSLI